MRVDGILLTSERENILKKDIATLLEELRTGVLKPVEVLEAYQAKSLVVDRDINAVCDYILEARDWALDLENTPVDERRALYGLPISVKVYLIDARMGNVSYQECFYVAGYDSTIGLAQHIGRPQPADCSFVSGVKELHALPFCLTNIPQTMLSWSCSNPVYGNTANPHDKTR